MAKPEGSEKAIRTSLLNRAMGNKLRLTMRHQSLFQVDDGLTEDLRAKLEELDRVVAARDVKSC